MSQPLLEKYFSTDFSPLHPDVFIRTTYILGKSLSYVLLRIQLFTSMFMFQTHRVMRQEQVRVREMRERKRTEPI